MRELKENLNVKKYIFSFYFCISSFQRHRQTDNYFSYLSCEQSFLHFPVEMANANDYWPTTIFIAVGQQFIFLPIKAGGKNL